MIFFFFNQTAPTETYTLSLHDALPISLAAHLKHARIRQQREFLVEGLGSVSTNLGVRQRTDAATDTKHAQDRKSTRLNSSHVRISYAVFCLKKKKKINTAYPITQSITS